MNENNTHSITQEKDTPNLTTDSSNIICLQDRIEREQQVLFLKQYTKDDLIYLCIYYNNGWDEVKSERKDYFMAGFIVNLLICGFIIMLFTI